MVVSLEEKSFSVESCNFMFVCDYNANMLKRRYCLQECFEVNRLGNLNKSENPTCIDLVDTSMPERIQNVSCFENGLSEFSSHGLIKKKFIFLPKRNSPLYIEVLNILKMKIISVNYHVHRFMYFRYLTPSMISAGSTLNCYKVSYIMHLWRNALQTQPSTICE